MQAATSVIAPDSYPPRGLCAAALRGDSTAARAVVDWLRESNFEHLARAVDAFTWEIDLQVRLARHIKYVLANAPPPARHRGRVDEPAIRLVLARAGVPVVALPRWFLGRVVVTSRAAEAIDDPMTPDLRHAVLPREQNAWALLLPRDWLGEDHDEGALATTDAVLDYLGAAFPRTRFEGADEIRALSDLGGDGQSHLERACAPDAE